MWATDNFSWARRCRLLGQRFYTSWLESSWFLNILSKRHSSEGDRVFFRRLVKCWQNWIICIYIVFLKWWSWNLQFSTNGSSDFQSWLCHCSECRSIQWVSKNIFFILAKRNLQFSVSWSLRRSYQTHTVEPSAQLIPRSERVYVCIWHSCAGWVCVLALI